MILAHLKCAQVRFLKCVDSCGHLHFFSEFQISGTLQFRGNFRQKSRISGNFLQFCKIGCIFAAMQAEKTAKKDGFRSSGFRDYPFSEISGFIPIYPNFTCVPCCAERFC
jgi:hypothetical protein